MFLGLLLSSLMAIEGPEIAPADTNTARSYALDEVVVVGEENWDDWQILKVSADCSDLIYPTYDRANYILLYQNSTGYLIVVAGEAEMETLEHIAREMEIRRSDIPKHEDINGLPVGSIDLARG